MPASYPLSLRTILRASKSRTQPPAFRMMQPRRGYGYAEASGTDTPVFWDVQFRFTQTEAALFQLWFTQDLGRGVDEFTLPIRTEFGTLAHTCRFLPDGLLTTRENGEVWEYSATIMARAQLIPEDAISSYGTVFAGPIPDQSVGTGVAFSLSLAPYWTGGAGPYTYSIVSGSLPAALTLNASTGVISGTTTSPVSVFADVVFRRTGAFGVFKDSNAVDFNVLANDANFGNVVLLLHGDGANAGTVFTDSSSFARTPSVATNVTTTTTQKKYGTASLSPTTNTAQLGWAASTSFAIVQVFTIEFWCYFTASSGSARYLFSESATRFFSVTGTSIGGGPTFNVPPTGSIPLNTWTHVAFVRQAGAGRAYVNGVDTGAVDTNGITSSATARRFQIYGVPDRADLLAPAVLIDDFRWTQNVARYTSNFTPPTGPYNNF